MAGPQSAVIKMGVTLGFFQIIIASKQIEVDSRGWIEYTEIFAEKVRVCNEVCCGIIH